MEEDLVTDRQRLHLRHDALDVPHGNHGDAFEQLVGVEAGASQSELDDPRPHRVRGCVDVDRPRADGLRLGDEPVTRPRANPLARHRPHVGEPASGEGPPEHHEHEERDPLETFGEKPRGAAIGGRVDGRDHGALFRTPNVTPET